MQSAETVLGVLRERGRRGLPLAELYRQLFNPQLYLLAYGRIYSNKGAMTPGPDAETADGMTMGKIERIIDAVRHERYRFRPVRRLYIPKKDGKQRPLGLPSWSDKLVGEVVRLLLEAYYEPQFSDHSHGYRPAGAATPPCARWRSRGPGRPGLSRATGVHLRPPGAGLQTHQPWPDMRNPATATGVPPCDHRAPTLASAPARAAQSLRTRARRCRAPTCSAC
jgi:hypothetical protein